MDVTWLTGLSQVSAVAVLAYFVTVTLPKITKDLMSHRSDMVNAILEAQADERKLNDGQLRQIVGAFNAVAAQLPRVCHLAENRHGGGRNSEHDD